MKAGRLMRELIVKYEAGQFIPLEELQAVERAIIRLEGRYEGSMIEAPHNIEEVGTYTAGKLEATEKHLADMRRLVMLENQKGEID